MLRTLLLLKKQSNRILHMDYPRRNGIAPPRMAWRTAIFVALAIAVLAVVGSLPAGAAQKAAGVGAMNTGYGVALSKPGVASKSNRPDTGGVLKVLPLGMITTTYDFVPGQVYTIMDGTPQSASSGVSFMDFNGN